MKRSMPWSDNEEDSASSDESSSSHSDSDVDETKGRDGSKLVEGQQSKEKKSQGKFGKRKGGAVDFEALKQHGYKGGRSVLSMRPREPDTQPDWSWSTGKERPRQPDEVEESYEQRQETRAAILVGEQLPNVVTSKERERRRICHSPRRRKGNGILVRLVVGRILLKKRRDYQEKMVFTLALT